MKKNKKFWTSEKLMSLSAMIIGISTLIVFIYQTNLIRKQQYMSVFPYLEVGNYFINSNQYSFIIHNKGIGPAIIKSVKVTTKGKVYDDIANYVNEMVNNKKDSLINYSYANIVIGSLISEKEKITIIKANDYYSGKLLLDILDNEDIDIEIIYESIYNEKWIYSNNSSITKKIH